MMGGGQRRYRSHSPCPLRPTCSLSPLKVLFAVSFCLQRPWGCCSKCGAELGVHRASNPVEMAEGSGVEPVQERRVKLPLWHVSRVPVMVTGDVSGSWRDLCSTGLWPLLNLARPCGWEACRIVKTPMLLVSTGDSLRMALVLLGSGQYCLSSRLNGEAQTSTAETCLQTVPLPPTSMDSSTFSEKKSQ